MMLPLIGIASSRDTGSSFVCSKMVPKQDPVFCLHVAVSRFGTVLVPFTSHLEQLLRTSITWNITKLIWQLKFVAWRI